ncbi:MAG: hypothetical protein ACRENE_23570, partial [Polyangiaceae bacterium]
SCSSGPGSAGSTPGATSLGQTGAACSVANQCFFGLDAAALNGAPACLTQLPNGYCTHTCTTDADCCAAPGECRTGFEEVCASFESSGQTYCFLGCSGAEVAAAPEAGTSNPTTYCQDWAGASFTCRSTGGGSQNRKFCGP